MTSKTKQFATEGLENKVNPKNPMKTMKMETENNKNRVGIYTQVSAEATAAGEGLAPQGEKSPVVTKNGNPSNSNNRNHNENIKMEINQSQCQYKMKDIVDPSEPFDKANPFRKETNTQAASHYFGQYDGGEDRINKDNKYRMNRILSMRKEFKKLNYTNSTIQAMEDALEDERKRRHNANKMARYCQQNDLDEQTAKQRMLERKEREIAKYKAEKAAREANRDKNRSLGDFRDDLTGSSNRLNQACGESKHDPEIVFTSPAILAGAKVSSKEQTETNSAKRGVCLSLDLPFSEERDHFRSPVDHFNRGGNNGYQSSDSSEPDATEKSVTNFCSSYTFRLSDKQKRKIAAGTYVPKPLDLRNPIEIQIINRAHPFGGFNDDDQLLLLNGLRNCLREERDNGAHGIKVGICDFIKRILHVHCRNNETVCCLERNIPFLNRLLPEADLYLSRKKVMFCFKKVRVSLKNYHLTTEEFFKIIKKQNDYPTETWREFWRKDDDQNMAILFGIDQKSYDHIKMNDGFVYFFFGKLYINCNKIEKRNRFVP